MPHFAPPSAPLPNDKVLGFFNQVAQAGAVFSPDVQNQLRTIIDDMSTRYYFVKRPDRAVEALDKLMQRGDNAALDAVVHVLCAEEVTIDLTRDKERYNAKGEKIGTIAGAAEALMGVIRRLPSDRQAKVLSAPYTVFVLADKGYGDEITGMIKKFPTLDQKVEVLSGEEAALGLAKHGQSPFLLSIVNDAKNDVQKASILKTPRFAYGIAKYGAPEDRAALKKIIHNFSPFHQADVLGAPETVRGLVESGEGDQTIWWIEMLRSTDLQERVLKGLGASATLQNFGYGDCLAAVIESIEQHKAMKANPPTLSLH